MPSHTHFTDRQFHFQHQEHLSAEAVGDPLPPRYGDPGVRAPPGERGVHGELRGGQAGRGSRGQLLFCTIRVGEAEARFPDQQGAAGPQV